MAKPRLEIHDDTFIHTGSSLSGEIVFGAGTVVHPYAVINAGEGKIIFGNNNIIEELCHIENKDPSKVMIIGNDNLFEVGTECHAVAVGNNNVFCIKSKVGDKVQVTDGCVIGPKCIVMSKEVLPPKTVVYGEGNNRRTAMSTNNSLKQHCELLQTKLRNFSQAYKNA
ncbi:unnamed protein product [Bursaphelenchus xylophilus]|uniref:Dynactin subunit 6 n=1 Tax=Bursaphelenchus xylophilus TaxID=6326 RepID=A0A1I7S741_BURXY|nr:unnamed protein product [Bursaphelenchus xylophilus]CAG9084584.1 unnamed protein product [Bursaphelenchus xylophilus]